MDTSVILAQLRGKWGPSGSHLRRCVGHGSGSRRASRCTVDTSHREGSGPPPKIGRSYCHSMQKNPLFSAGFWRPKVDPALYQNNVIQYGVMQFP